MKSFSLDTCGLAIVDMRSSMGSTCSCSLIGYCSLSQRLALKRCTFEVERGNRPMSRPFRSNSEKYSSALIGGVAAQLFSPLLLLLLFDAAVGRFCRSGLSGVSGVCGVGVSGRWSMAAAPSMGRMASSSLRPRKLCSGFREFLNYTGRILIVKKTVTKCFGNKSTHSIRLRLT